MVQRGDGAGLTLEPLLEIRIRRDMLWQHLDGDRAVEAGVGGLVDLTHTARADLGGETLMATPALSEGVLYIRTRGHLVAVGPDAT